MLEFKTIQELKPNEEILDIIKTYKYKIINGKIKTLLNTNLQFIEPTKYIITYPITLTILENQYLYKYCLLLIYTKKFHDYLFIS